uniref:midnolin homolog n=1 Tax=Styela clava TaxID=7725 RepID=UPI00193A419B|nr:midnolin homolog [Styela clava]
MDSQSPSDASHANPSGHTRITINVHPTTGGQFQIEISPDETAEELRRKISRRLQTPKERLKVLYKEQVLEARPLREYNVVDGSKVTLLPSVESGFSSTVQGTQQSIIQAIESLSDPQIDDFLSGRLPLTLALRVGDHMMFVQLQLEQSQVNSQNADNRPSRSHSSIPISQLRHSSSTCISPRLFTGVPSESASSLGATSLLPKSPIDLNKAKILSPSGTPANSVMGQPITTGPSPKIPKLSAKSDVSKESEYVQEGPDVTGIVHKSERFHHHHPHSAPSSPEELPYAFLDPRFDSLQQITHHYNQLASQLNHHTQSGANHLRRLVTACSSLEQVVAIPPPGMEHLKVPTTPEHNRKSSRKRPSSMLSPTELSPPPSSSQRTPYPENVGHALPTVIQNALLRQHSHLNGFAPSHAASLLSSAYAEYRASYRPESPRNSVSCPSGSSSQASTTPAEIKLKHPITSTMLQTSSSGSKGCGTSRHPSRSERSHRRASTSGRMTSGSLSHHSSGISGARVARQMQRLRRLCGSHQQCVAYSNRELATEISSIVHMARHSHHHSRSEGSTHRKSHKACRECHSRGRTSSSMVSGVTDQSSDSSAPSGQAAGACIDSFTTHGPGIFSGTFSGSLHPSIQDADGRPKRDPKTILQILTDLLNATQQYQGQLGNVGLLPQLFKDHFKADSAVNANKNKENGKAHTHVAADKKDVNTPPPSESEVQQPGTSKQPILTPQRQQPKLRPSNQSHHHQPKPVYNHSYLLPPTNMAPEIGQKLTAPAQYMSSVSTIPIGAIPVTYGSRHGTSRSSRRNSPAGNVSSKYYRSHSRCHHHHKHHSVEKASCCGSSSCRRQAKAQMMLSASYIKREHENSNTRSKMKELKKKMDRQRHRRQIRRSNSSKVIDKPELVAENQTTSGIAIEPVSVVAATHDNATTRDTNMEVQFDDIKKDFEIKEVAHEPPETVTV